MNKINKSTEWSFRWLQVESLLTVMVFIVPIYTLFASEIGMTQTQIGITQAVFMAVAMIVDVPSGWVADRFSRKFCNFFGDMLSFVGFMGYFLFANSFVEVLLMEALLGAGVAFTNGADVALLKSYAKELGQDYQKLSAKLGSFKPLAEMLAFAVGGLLASYNLRLTFLVTALAFLAGAVISLFIKEVGVKRITQNHPIRDMYEIAKYSLHGHAGLKWRIIASAVATNITHTLIWLFTPMLIVSGVTKSFLGITWAATLLVVSLGSAAAVKFGKNLKDINKLFVPLIACIVAYLVLGASISAATIWIVLIFSASRGWFMATLSPMIQSVAPPDIQATVISVSSLLRRLLYIPLVMLVNYLGDKSLEVAMLGSALIYVAILLPVYIGFKRSS